MGTSLPVEIWQTIFQYSLPYPNLTTLFEAGKALDSSTLSFTRSRVTLCLVSKRWRNWIYETPTLWSTIIIYAHVAPSVEVVKLWCRLSATCSLDIYADPFAPKPSLQQLREWWNMPTPRCHPNFPELLALFASNIARIRRLVLPNWEDSEMSLSMLFPSNTLVHAPRLEMLFILGHGTKGESDTLELIDAPRLHTMCIRPAFWSLNAKCYPRLRSLSISTEGLQPTFLPNLSMFLQLEYLAIHPSRSSLPWSPGEWLHDPRGALSPVTLPAVKHIYIESELTEFTSLVLKRIHLPKLESLTCRIGYGQRRQVGVDILSTLSEYPCLHRIRYLNLEGVYFGEAAGRIPWFVLPCLEVIRFVGSYIDSSFYHVMMMDVLPQGLKRIIFGRATQFPMFHLHTGGMKGLQISVEAERIITS